MQMTSKVGMALNKKYHSNPLENHLKQPLKGFHLALPEYSTICDNTVASYDSMTLSYGRKIRDSADVIALEHCIIFMCCC